MAITIKESELENTDVRRFDNFFVKHPGSTDDLGLLVFSKKEISGTADPQKAPTQLCIEVVDQHPENALDRVRTAITKKFSNA